MTPRFVRICIFDWDGVAALPSDVNIQSMRYGVQNTLQELNKLQDKKVFFDKNAFLKTLKDTSGTTEEVFFETMLSNLGVKRTDILPYYWSLAQDYMAYRAKYYKDFNERMHQSGSDEKNIYNDFLTLLERLKQQDRDRSTELRSFYAVATGNPREVMDQRLPANVKEKLDFIRGGEFGEHRGNLLNDVYMGLRFDHNITQENVHIFYTDDSPRGLRDAWLLSDRSTRSYPLNERLRKNLHLIHINRDQQRVSGPLSEPSGEEEDHHLISVSSLDDPRLLVYFDPYTHEKDREMPRGERTIYFGSSKEK